MEAARKDWRIESAFDWFKAAHSCTLRAINEYSPVLSPVYRDGDYLDLMRHLMRMAQVVICQSERLARLEQTVAELSAQRQEGGEHGGA